MKTNFPRLDTDSAVSKIPCITVLDSVVWIVQCATLMMIMVMIMMFMNHDSGDDFDFVDDDDDDEDSGDCGDDVSRRFGSRSTE